MHEQDWQTIVQIGILTAQTQLRAVDSSAAISTLLVFRFSLRLLKLHFVISSTANQFECECLNGPKICHSYNLFVHILWYTQYGKIPILTSVSIVCI